MLSIKRILVPVDLPVASLAELHQAATLARHFKSEIVLLHVLTERSRSAGVPEESGELARWDLLAAILSQAKAQQDRTLASEFGGLIVHRRLAKGDTAAVIVRTAQEEKSDLIMMPSHGFTFCQFLLGSVTARVLCGTECPVWTGAHVPGSPAQEFAIRSVLCAVEFGTRTAKTVAWASQIASEFGAHLTLANVTAEVKKWGAGGDYVDQRWKEELVANASEQMAKLQKEMGLKVEVVIGSGDPATVLGQAATQTKADLLVTPCYPYSDRMRTHGYGIICAVPIPVLSV